MTLKFLKKRRTITDTDVLDERIKLESKSTAIGASGVMLAALVVYLVMPLTIEHANYLFSWLILQWFFGVIWLFFIAYHNVYKTAFTQKIWPLVSSTICSFYGFMWGAGWVFFISSINKENLHTALIFTIILSGVFSGGLLATIFNLVSLIAFMLFSLLPPFLYSLLNNDGLFNAWFSVSIIIYMLACTAFALNLHNFLLDTLEQREEKAKLLALLAIEKQKVERISLDKTHFLASASHDLRQPLQALTIYHEIMREQIKTSNKIENEILLKAESSIIALSTMLNAMLDISQLDAGNLKLTQKDFKLNEVFRHIYTDCQPLAVKNNIYLKVLETNFIVFSDPILITRIIRNLVENAIKHLGRPGKVLLGARRKGNTVSIEVLDTGIGIPLAKQKEIFKEFVQVNNSERKRSQGLGLGLFIVKRLIAELNSSIDLVSEPNKGTVFKFRIPIGKKTSELKNLQQVLHNTEVDNSLSKILLIEDDPDVMDSLNSLLTIWGYDVTALFNPKIYDILNNLENFKLIISDYQLNEQLNGIKVIEIIRERLNLFIPAIIITGNTNPIILKKFKKHNIQYLYKPIEPLYLKKILTELI